MAKSLLDEDEDELNSNIASQPIVDAPDLESASHEGADAYQESKAVLESQATGGGSLVEKPTSVQAALQAREYLKQNPYTPVHHQTAVDPREEARILAQSQAMEERSRRETEAQRRQIEKGLKAQGIEFEVDEWGNEEIAKHQDGSPRFKAGVVKPFEWDENKRPTRVERDVYGNLIRVDILKSGVPGKDYKRDDATGEYFVETPEGPQWLGERDEKHIQTRSLAAIRARAEGEYGVHGADLAATRARMKEIKEANSGVFTFSDEESNEDDLAARVKAAMEGAKKAEASGDSPLAWIGGQTRQQRIEAARLAQQEAERDLAGFAARKEYEALAQESKRLEREMQIRRSAAANASLNIAALKYNFPVEVATNEDEAAEWNEFRENSGVGGARVTRPAVYSGSMLEEPEVEGGRQRVKREALLERASAMAAHTNRSVKEMMPIATAEAERQGLDVPEFEEEKPLYRIKEDGKISFGQNDPVAAISQAVINGDVDPAKGIEVIRKELNVSGKKRDNGTGRLVDAASRAAITASNAINGALGGLVRFLGADELADDFAARQRMGEKELRSGASTGLVNPALEGTWSATAGEVAGEVGGMMPAVVASMGAGGVAAAGAGVFKALRIASLAPRLIGVLPMAIQGAGSAFEGAYQKAKSEGKSDEEAEAIGNKEMVSTLPALALYVGAGALTDAALKPLTRVLPILETPFARFIGAAAIDAPLNVGASAAARYANGEPVEMDAKSLGTDLAFSALAGGHAATAARYLPTARAMANGSHLEIQALRGIAADKGADTGLRRRAYEQANQLQVGARAYIENLGARPEGAAAEHQAALAKLMEVEMGPDGPSARDEKANAYEEANIALSKMIDLSRKETMGIAQSLVNPRNAAAVQKLVEGRDLNSPAAAVLVRLGKQAIDSGVIPPKQLEAFKASLSNVPEANREAVLNHAIGASVFGDSYLNILGGKALDSNGANYGYLSVLQDAGIAVVKPDGQTQINARYLFLLPPGMRERLAKNPGKWVDIPDKSDAQHVARMIREGHTDAVGATRDMTPDQSTAGGVKNADAAGVDGAADFAPAADAVAPAIIIERSEDGTFKSAKLNLPADISPNQVERLRVETEKSDAPAEIKKGLTEQLDGELVRQDEAVRASRNEETGERYSRSEDESQPSFIRRLAESFKAIGSKSVSADKIRSQYSKISEKWANKPEVEVIDRYDDLPESVREHYRSGGVEAFYQDGKVVIIAEKMKSSADVARVVLHESVGHHGLRGAFGDKLDYALDRLTIETGKGVTDLAKKLGLDVRDPAQRREAAEEYFARQTEPKQLNSLTQWMKGKLKSLFPGVKFEDDYVRGLVARAQEFIRDGKGAASSNDGVRFSQRAGDKPTDEVFAPDGKLDWGEITPEMTASTKGAVPAGPIRLLNGKHFGANRGYGLEHWLAEHSGDLRRYGFEPDKFLHRVLQSFTEVYQQSNGRIVLVAPGKPRSLGVVELRPEKGGFYSVVTAYPKDSSTAKAEGRLIWRGRRAPAQPSASQSSRTAQEPSGEPALKLPREPLEDQINQGELSSRDDGSQQNFNARGLRGETRFSRDSALATPEQLEGDKLNRSWTEFADDSGSLGIPRAEMPQIKAEHRGALTQFLKGRGINSNQKEILPGELKPTQREYSQGKVDKAREFTGGDRAILVSSDGHVVDGHHQWMAKLTDKPTEVMRVIELGAPIRDLLPMILEFPSVENPGGAGKGAGDIRFSRARQNEAQGGANSIIEKVSSAFNGDWNLSDWFVHGRRGSQDLTTGNVIQLTQDPRVADQYAGKEGSRWTLKPNDSAKILGPNDAGEVYAQLKRGLEDGSLPFEVERLASEFKSLEDFRGEFAPKSIVDSAGLWDNPDFASWVWDRFGADGVKFPDTRTQKDALVVLNLDGFNGIRVDDGRAFKWTDGEIQPIDEGGDIRFSKSPKDKNELTPEEKFLIGSQVEKGLRGWRRLFDGAADVLERTKGLESLGQKVRKHIDRSREIQGKASAVYDELNRREGNKAFNQAEREVTAYYQTKDRSPAAAAELEAMMSPEGKTHLATWRAIAGRFAEFSDRLNVRVQNGEGEWRKMGKIGDYHPRMLNPQYREAIADPSRNPKKWREVVKIMIDAGMGKDETEVLNTFKKAGLSGTVSNDFFANIERARELELPNKLYDYSFESRRRYMMNAAERLSQIEAYGQRLGDPNGKRAEWQKDAFEKALDGLYDPSTIEYVRSVSQRAYGETTKDMLHRSMAILNSLATGTMLANPLTVATNLASGFGYGATTLGIRNSLKALGEIRRYGDLAAEAQRKGVILDDLMNLQDDVERLGSTMASRVQKGVGFALKWSGFNASEEFVRAMNYAASKSFLRDGLDAMAKDPNSRRARKAMAFFKRNNLNAEKLYKEDGEGQETDRFFRTVVNAAQGGYRIDQVPVYMDSPLGRFLFKYQKWGAQATRNFAKNVVDPLIGRSGPVDVMPAIRYLAVTAAVGAGLAAFREEIFGSADKTASLEEIAKTWSADERRAIGLAISKLFGYQLMSGAYGMAGNYAQMATDVMDRSRFKSPLEPPGIAVVTNTGDQMLRLIEQGTLTPKDAHDFLRAQLSAYRTGAAAVGRIGGMPFERKRQDLAWLGTRTRRFADEIGVSASRTQLGRVGKTPDSPVLRKINESLMIGDVATARESIAEYLSGAQTPEAKEARRRSLAQSVRARQPIRVGAAGEARRVMFLDWARKRLPEEEVRRIREIDQVYRTTAQRVGLFSNKGVSAKQLNDTKARYQYAGR